MLNTACEHWRDIRRFHPAPDTRIQLGWRRFRASVKSMVILVREETERGVTRRAVNSGMKLQSSGYFR